MKKAFWVSVVSLLIIAGGCSKSNHEQEPVARGYTLHIQVKAAPQEDGWVFLEKITSKRPEKIDSIQTDAEGNAVITGRLESPGYFVLNTYGRNRDFFPLFNDDLKIIVNNNGKQNTAEISGSKLVEQYDKLETMNTAFQARLQSLADSIRATAHSEEEQAAKKEEYIRLQTKELVKFKSGVKDYLSTIRPSFVSLYATQYFDMSSDFTYLDSLVRELKTKYIGNDYIVEFAEMLQKAASVSKGSVAPEINLADVEGKNFSLSSLRGKYVLVDFWASWCGPCRRNNPALVALYKKLKGNNFEILGVSLDKEKAAWLEAIKKDNLAWKQVSDLKYWDSQAAKDYQVESIPTSFLIDPTGKILGSNLTEIEVEEIVSKPKSNNNQ